MQTATPGDADARFIFKSAGNIFVASGVEVKLEGGALPANIVWQLAGYLDVGTEAKLNSIFLVKTHAAFKTRSSLNGRVLVQTAVTLDQATITHPAASSSFVSLAGI